VGHRAPYVAVITLAVMAAHHYRTLRTKLLLAGISDPMGLRTMHMLLDTIESMVLESMSMSGDRDAEFKRAQFIDSLYSPVVAGGSGAPAGFSPDEVDSAFDAFAAASGSAL
jgi:hypothetical protein